MKCAFEEIPVQLLQSLNNGRQTVCRTRRQKGHVGRNGLQRGFKGVGGHNFTNFGNLNSLVQKLKFFVFFEKIYTDALILFFFMFWNSFLTMNSRILIKKNLKTILSIAQSTRFL